MVFRATLLTFFLFGTLTMWSQIETDSGYVSILDPETLYTFSALEGRDFLQRQPLNLPEPLFAGTETGLVAIEFEILPQGVVTNVSSIPEYSTTKNIKMIQAALTAVANWRFQPLGVNIGASKEPVQVLVQFNYPESDVRYSADGRFILKGLRGREPVRLIEPKPTYFYEGKVNVTMVLDANGHVVRLDNFYGAYPNVAVVPRLGILAHDAIINWQFAALPSANNHRSTPKEQKIAITCMFPKRRLNPEEGPNSSMSSLTGN